MTSERGVISYPIPLYQNVPIHSEYYQPSRFVIKAISLGFTTVVTTNTIHNYTIGQDVRLIIPSAFGCYQLNEAKANVLSIPSTTQVELSINSIVNVDPFISATATTSSPQILAIGDVNSGATNSFGRSSTATFIPGSFIDISPK